MTIYKCIEETKTVKDKKETVYSLSYDGKIISDISPDREKVEQLADVFNRESLDPIHLPFILEELL